PRLDPASRDFSLRMDELIDLAESGQAPARDWQELGWYLSSVPLVHLRATTWQRLATQVVFTLPRSVKVGYRQYSTAVMNIASLPRAHDFLVEAVAAYVAEPNVQVVTNPIGLLDRLPTRQAARLVLDLIEHPHSDAVFTLAVWLASQKLARGDFDDHERARLDMLVLTLWRANPEKAGNDLAELIARLPDGMRSTLVSAARQAGRGRLGYVVEHAEESLSPLAAHAGVVAHAMAESARRRVPQQAAYGEDTMLTRLVREAVFHRDSERRHLAALVISASPFGEAVADELLELLDAQVQHSSQSSHSSAEPEWLRVRAATLVRYLCTDRHRMRMLGLLDDRTDRTDPGDAVAAPIAQGLGHLRFDAVSDQVLRRSLRDSPGQSPGRLPDAPPGRREAGTMYALGMTGSPALAAIARSADAPGWQRDAARWWLAHGSAVLT
ncbi:MAG: hypothetical protein ACRDPB_05435, partial [Nocardioidaceae bacterium]